MTNDEQLTITDPHPIEIEFFSKRTNKTTQLINSPDSFRIEGVNRWYEYEFIEPVYLTELKIESTGYSDRIEFEIEVIHSDNTVHNQFILVNGGVVVLGLGKLATGFRFRPPQRWIVPTEILSVVATGYTLAEFHSFEWALKNLNSREESITKREEAYESLEESENDLGASIKELTSEVGKLTAERKVITDSLASLSTQIKSEEASKKDIETEIKSLQEEKRGIRTDIARDTSELDNLTKKLRLFPAEISELVREGTRNIWNYFVLGLPFAIILFVILWAIFSNSIDLTQLWRKEADIDVWTIFLTRIPFVLVAIALVETCGYILGRLIFEVIKINRQRLDFSKLSIVAKDVVTSASFDTEMTETERYEEELKLRMMLLQEHMKSYSQEEFKYSGSAISSAIINVASKFTGNKS